MRKVRFGLTVAVAMLAGGVWGWPSTADAQGYGAGRQRAVSREVESTGSLGRAPWNQPHEYDSGSDNDHRPALPYYQQGRAQQTGGPSRNLLPSDGFTITPR